MFTESEWMYERQKLYELRQGHPDWSLRSLARTVQHDLTWVRKWVKRFEGWAEPHQTMFRSQSRQPRHRPQRLTDPVKDTICALRETLSERFHRAAGRKPFSISCSKRGYGCQAPAAFSRRCMSGPIFCRAGRLSMYQWSVLRRWRNGNWISAKSG